MKPLVWALVVFLSACSAGEPLSPALPPPEPPTTPSATTMQLKVGSTVFSVTLAQNAAAKGLAAQLPLTAAMHDLNGNEKYYYLPRGLPTSSERPSTIQRGDIMLFGSECLVVFFQPFTNSYSYTRIGHIDNPEGLETALGAGSVTVTFQR